MHSWCILAILFVCGCGLAAGNSLLQIRVYDGQRHSTPLNSELNSIGLGVISYWSPSSGYYYTLPQGSLAVLNPLNGVFKDQSLETLPPDISKYQEIVAKTAASNISMLGYVPTGYFNHTCNINAECQTLERIGKQIDKYFELFPQLAGIFFDEVAPHAQDWDCHNFHAEYDQLRTRVRSHSTSAKIAFNTAVPSTCVVDAVNAGEILVQYEMSAENYGTISNHDNLMSSASYARSKGVKTWHLVHTASADQLHNVLEKARKYQVDWFFTTDVGGNWEAGDNTWGSTPAYWDELKASLDYLSATVAPFEIAVGGAANLTLSRPVAQCCVEFDWVGIYKKDSSERIAFVHSGNNEDQTVTFGFYKLGGVDLYPGEYEFKYSTSVDGWQLHSLAPAVLRISVPTWEVLPSAIEVGGSASLTLNRPAAQCCVEFDWVGIYQKGSNDRIGFIHSGNSEDETVTLALHDLVVDLGPGEYEFKYSTSLDGWQLHTLPSATLEIIDSDATPAPPQNTKVDATVTPSEIALGGSASLTLNRPAAQCCAAFDWVGIYPKGTTNRLGFIHSGNSNDQTVTLVLDGLVANLSTGDFEFKYSTGVDGWQIHSLASATLTITQPRGAVAQEVTELTATVTPLEIVIGGSAHLTLNRPAAQCCNAYDWVGIYRRGSTDRLGFIHSANSRDTTVTLALDDLIDDIDAGEYEFKYSTSVDGWQVHSLVPATLEIRA